MRARIALAFLFLTVARHSAHAAEELVVPPAVQVGLFARVATYVRDLGTRSRGTVRILVLTKGGDVASERAGQQIVGALAGVKTICGLPHADTMMAFTTRAALTAHLAREPFTAVYLMPGLAPDLRDISEALDSSGVLSVSSVPGFVSQGAVLGFDLVSGKPQLLINPARMRAQNVSLPPGLIAIMKVQQ